MEKICIFGLNGVISKITECQKNIFMPWVIFKRFCHRKTCRFRLPALRNLLAYNLHWWIANTQKLTRLQSQRVESDRWQYKMQMNCGNHSCFRYLERHSSMALIYGSGIHPAVANLAMGSMSGGET